MSRNSVQKRDAASAPISASTTPRDLGRAARALELEHVAFGDQPIAEIDSLDGKSVAAAIDQARALGMDEVGRRGDAQNHGPQKNGRRKRRQRAARKRCRAAPWRSSRRKSVPQHGGSSAAVLQAANTGDPLSRSCFKRKRNANDAMSRVRLPAARGQIFDVRHAVIPGARVSCCRRHSSSLQRSGGISIRFWCSWS